MALFGGNAPVVATWMIRETGDLASPAIYLVVLSLVSLYALWTFDAALRIGDRALAGCGSRFP